MARATAPAVAKARGKPPLEVNAIAVKVPDAMRLLEAGQIRGKVVITV